MGEENFSVTDFQEVYSNMNDNTIFCFQILLNKTWLIFPQSKKGIIILVTE